MYSYSLAAGAIRQDTSHVFHTKIHYLVDIRVREGANATLSHE